jgi:hypothetical protein
MAASEKADPESPEHPEYPGVTKEVVMSLMYSHRKGVAAKERGRSATRYGTVFLLGAMVTLVFAILRPESWFTTSGLLFLVGGLALVEERIEHACVLYWYNVWRETILEIVHGMYVEPYRTRVRQVYFTATVETWLQGELFRGIQNA